MRPFAPIAAILTVLLLAVPASALGAADLTTAVTADPASLPLGGSETSKLKVSVTNTGPDTAANVDVGPFVIPPQLTFIGFSGISQGSVGYVGASKTITANFGSIPTGVTATFDFVLDDEESGRGTMTVNAKTTTEEIDTSDNTVLMSIDVLALVPTVSQFALPSQVVGGIGPPQSLSIVNQAAIPVQVGAVTQLAGGDFLTSSDGCSGATLAPGASCPIATRFAPSVAGERAGTTTVSSPTAKVNPATVTLTGTGIAPDKLGPALALASVPKSLKAKKFKKGFQVAITPNEAAALEVQLLGTPKGGALASSFELKLFDRSLPLAAGTRKVKVKPTAKLLGPIKKKFAVRLRIVATDAAGNRSSASRTIKVRPSNG